MKTVFITGAAHGIGLATAKLFASRGYCVGLYDINREALATVMAAEEFTNARSGYCDVTSRESIESALADFTAANGGKLDILVNNAGVLSAGLFETMQPDPIDAMIAVNVRGFTHVAQAGFPYLRDTAGACMVNLCSVSSVHGIPNLAVYSASKFYVNGLTEALYLEWAPHDIRVCCVKPELVTTQMGQAVVATATTPQTINLTPEDVAAAIVNAVSGKRIAYFVGRTAKIWAFIDRLLPGMLRTRFTASLLGSKS